MDDIIRTNGGESNIPDTEINDTDPAEIFGDSADTADQDEESVPDFLSEAVFDSNLLQKNDNNDINNEKTDEDGDDTETDSGEGSGLVFGSPDAEEEMDESADTHGGVTVAEDSYAEMTDSRVSEAVSREYSEEKKEGRLLLDILNTARRSRSMVMVTVTSSYAEDDGRDGILPTLYAQALYKSADGRTFITVNIPFSEMVRDSQIAPISADEMSSRRGRRVYLARQRTILENFYGLETSVIITDIRRDGFITASRREALIRMEYNNFSGSDPRIKEGDIINGRVISVSSRGILLNIGGVDTLMRWYRLTYRYCPTGSFAKFYRMNDELPVQILGIREDRNHNHYIQATHRVFELERAKKVSADYLREGQNVTCTVTTINSDVNIAHVQMIINGYNVPAFSSMVMPRLNARGLQPGNSLRCTITHLLPSGYARVIVRGIAETLNAFSR